MKIPRVAFTCYSIGNMPDHPAWGTSLQFKDDNYLCASCVVSFVSSNLDSSQEATLEFIRKELWKLIADLQKGGLDAYNATTRAHSIDLTVDEFIAMLSERVTTVLNFKHQKTELS